MPPLGGCQATAQITATVYELVFIIRGSKLCVAKKLALPELTKMIGVKSTGGDTGQDNISDDRGRTCRRNMCFYFIYLFIYKVWCVNSMLSPTLLNKVSISQFFFNTFIVVDLCLPFICVR